MRLSPALIPVVACALLAACVDDPAQPEPGAPANAVAAPPGHVYTLVIAHNNDGESELLPDGDVGGVARFASVIDRLRAEVLNDPSSVPGNGKARGQRDFILVSSGDNYLAGPQFNSSLVKGIPFHDALALGRIGYDAFAIGNHEFDFGPDVFADFIRSFGGSAGPFLSANLDVSGEPVLAALAGTGRIAKSTIVQLRGDRIGIVGATTPQLSFISSPRNVKVLADVAAAINAEVAALEARGINKILLIAHLQSVQEDLALIPMLDGVDVAVAGGGDELLANENDPLIPGDESEVFGPYPLLQPDRNGTPVPVITTSGQYRYAGRLEAMFDKDGNLIGIGEKSGAIRVVGTSFPDGVTPDPWIQAQVVAPVQAAVAALASNVIGQTQVVLDGRRSQVRTRETNEGNLVADALLWQATQLAGGLGLPTPDVALQNGGGIRNDSEIPAGALTELTTFDILPFSNFVSIVPGISRQQFREILENAVSRVENVDGRFAQIAGFAMTWDATGTAQLLDAAGNVTTVGSRVVDVTLADGTPIVVGGVVQAGPALSIATIDFLARSGDQYPYRGAGFTTIGVSYQQALLNYIVSGLGGVVTGADYPLGGEGRITRLN